MKKLLAITLLVCTLLFSLAGCDKSSENNQNNLTKKSAQEYGYFTLNGIDWGITDDELFKRLKINKDDIEVYKPESTVHKFEDGTEYSINTTLYSIKTKFMDEEVMATYKFVNAPLTDKETLNNIFWEYSSDFSKEKYTKICDYIEETIKNQNIETANPSITIQKGYTDEETGEYASINNYEEGYDDFNAEYEYETFNILSSNDMSDLPQNMRDSFNSFYVYLYDKEPIENLINKNYKEIDYTQSLYAPLSSFGVTYRKEVETGDIRGTVSISGKGISTAKLYVETYDKIKEDKKD